MIIFTNKMAKIESLSFANLEIRIVYIDLDIRILNMPFYFLN